MNIKNIHQLLVQFALISGVLFQMSAIANPTLNIVADCESYLRDTGTRVRIYKAQERNASETYFIVHEEMSSTGYRLISRAQIAQINEGVDGIVHYIAHRNITSLEVDLTKIISNRYGNTGNPAKFLATTGESMDLKCLGAR